MLKSQAFTLVELLAVITIITLLITIFVPSLKAAKDLAKATYCMTTLSALNKSVFMYAENNRGYMMVYTHDFIEGYIAAPKETPWKTYACFATGRISPTTGLLEDARNFGLVYATGLLRPADLFYCPNQRDPRMTLNFYPKPWGTALPPDPGTNLIRNGYMWNPWVKRNPRKLEEVTYEDALVLARHPNEWFLTCDLLDRYQTMSHVMANTAKWNLAFTDAHVELWESKELYLYHFQNPGSSAFAQWNVFNSDIRPKLPGNEVKLKK